MSATQIEAKNNLFALEALDNFSSDYFRQAILGQPETYTTLLYFMFLK